MMITFHFKNEILERLTEALGKSDRTDLAIAYWGNGAIDTLGLRGLQGHVQILCDACSGACNPHELRKLLEIPNIKLKTLSKLHAKVIITTSSIIVGSANASCNGLGEEGKEAGNEEAVIITDDPNCRQQAQDWFNTVWNGENSKWVDDRMLKKIEPLWRDRRRNRPPRSAKSLLETLREQPDWFKDRGIRLIAYRSENPSPDVMQRYQEIRPQYYSAEEIDSYEQTDEIPFYEDQRNWLVRPGEYVLDFQLAEDGSVKPGGAWRIRNDNAFHDVGEEARLILCERIERPFGLEVSEVDLNLLAQAISEYITRHNPSPDNNDHLIDWPLDRAGELLFQKGANAWLLNLNPARRQAILRFAESSSVLAGRQLDQVLVGILGEGVQPNFRLVFDDGSEEDYHGNTYNQLTGSFTRRREPFVHRSHLVRLQ